MISSVGNIFLAGIHVGHVAKILNFWVPFLSGLAIITTFLSTTFVVMHAATGSDYISIWIVIRARRKTICKTLKKTYQFNRRELNRANRERLRNSFFLGQSFTVLTEIEWLSARAKENDFNWVNPLELCGITKLIDPIKYPPSRQLKDLADAYLKFSQTLRAQALLNTNLFMIEQQEFAFSMAKYLELNSKFRSNEFLDKDILKVSLSLPQSKIDIELINPRINLSPNYQIDDLAIIYTRSGRLVVKDFQIKNSWRSEENNSIYLDLKRNIPDSNETYLSTLTKHFSSSRFFDAVLPALNGYHLQVDPTSGHLRLVLEISEINYSAVVANHYVGSELGAGYSRLELNELSTIHSKRRLVTLSMLPVSSDGYFLIAERSNHVGVEKEKLQPGVVGNLEFRERIGLKLDVDQFGLPDFLVATSREAKEELGLDVAPEQLQILGLGKFSSEVEVDTWLHMTLAQLPHTLVELMEISKTANLTEGAWEFSGNFIKISFPKTSEDAENILAWVIHSDKATPHLIMTLLAICLPLLSPDCKSRPTESETLQFWQSRLTLIISGVYFPPPRGFEEITRN